MTIEIRMPALSPTMEEGTLAKWLVKAGDSVLSGDLLAEIETDKATMEFEAVDEGVVAELLVPAGTENVKVGTVIARMSGEVGEAAAPAPVKAEAAPATPPQQAAAPVEQKAAPAPAVPMAAKLNGDARLRASPLARRLAAAQNIDLSAVVGSGPNGRIVKADLDGTPATITPMAAAAQSATTVSAPVAAAPVPVDGGHPTPHELVKLSGMRKTIARRLTESKQQVPHIYLTVDIRLDALLKLRGELNDSLAPRGVKLSVNDLLIKALALSLVAVPECNVSFAGDQMLQFARADISVAVSIPAGLITPIVTNADAKSISAISTEMKGLADRAKSGKLAPEEYQGGTASISNMGMMGIKQFEAVINPPQGMILAIGAGERRPWVMPDDSLGVATVMSATGSFDHRAIDGADGARLMAALRELVERPLGLLA